MGYAYLPHGVPVLETVAAQLREAAGDDPVALSRALVLLPTRRAARALGAAFLRQAGDVPLLLPRLVAIGDIDTNPLFEADAASLPPAVPALERQVALARLVAALDVPPHRALRLAADLAALLDEAAEAEIDLAGLAALRPDRFAQHWQDSMRFLEIATGAWARELAARGATDAVPRRAALLHRLAARLAAERPASPVLAVGIAAPAPSTAALLAAIAGLPQGLVVLAGLDPAMPQAAWDAIDDAHPQAELKALLARLKRDRAGIPPLAGAAPSDRARLLGQALLPAQALDWQAPPPGATQGIALIDAPDSAEEARAIALAVREALEDPQARIAVITPDRALAERVAAALARFEIHVEDSAAIPLGRTPPGALLRLLVAAVARDMAPVPLLSLLRHPLVAGGMAPARFRAAGRNFELAALRGPRPGARTVLTAAALDPRRLREADRPGVAALQQAVAAALRPLRDLLAADRAAASALLRETVAAAEALCATDGTPGAARLWNGPEGAALARHVAACDAALAPLPPIDPRGWPDLLDQLLAGESVRARRALAGGAAAAHPRVELLGVLEARLLFHDVRILAGLNEGTWPALPDPGPWLSRAQRQSLGLASPDAAVGFAAADFVAAATSCTRLVLSRAARAEGEPAVASRWLTRLAALCGSERLRGGTDHVALAFLLDDRGGLRRDEQRPAPRPRLDVRPRELPVTAVETLRRNPYAVYAQRILQLRPLDPLDQEADTADWGSLVHGVAAKFFAGLGALSKPDAQALFMQHAARELAQFNARPGLVALWRPRLATLAPWFAETFAERPSDIFLAEVSGRHAFAFDSGGFILTARADLVVRGAAGALHLIDFKTGQVPSGKAVRAGQALQLPLSALIAAAGGFTRSDTEETIAELTYARLPGGAESGRMIAVAGASDLPDTMATAYDILATLVAQYAAPAQGYRANAVDDDFAHLSRRGAWGETPDAEDAE
jgi:ATP-dependent helicase/nuclease subunit B